MGLKKSFALVLCLILAALLTLNGAARSAAPAPPDDFVRSGSTPTPAAAQANHTLFLPFIAHNAMTFQGPNIPFGYGWNVFWENFNANNPTTNFGWVKFSVSEPTSLSAFCGGNDLPYNVLLRLNWAMSGVGIQYGKDRVYEVASGLKQLSGSGDLCVQAFEIGNEPNLFSMYGGRIDPVVFAQQLCAQYDIIKSVDPNYIVVSGGVAPTGDIDDANVAVNETVFLSRMLTYIRDTRGDAGACFDVLGYHNYGFRTGYATDPNDAALCASDMCFRGIEHAWDILYGEYGVSKRIWSTEMGWLRDFTQNSPPCTNLLSVFDGFQNSDQGQADQLVAAFQYARTHWLWSGAMFVFNHDFNHRPPWQANHCYDEQGWFAVDDHPAENALENMLKP
jgi:hypothetical protein